MNEFLSNALFVVALLYIGVQLLHLFVLVVDNDLCKSAMKNFLFQPYKEGMRLGDLFLLFFWTPSIVLAFVLGVAIMLVVRISMFLFHLRLTSPKDK